MLLLKLQVFHPLLAKDRRDVAVGESLSDLYESKPFGYLCSVDECMLFLTAIYFMVWLKPV